MGLVQSRAGSEGNRGGDRPSQHNNSLEEVAFSDRVQDMLLIQDVEALQILSAWLRTSSPPEPRRETRQHTLDSFALMPESVREEYNQQLNY